MDVTFLEAMKNSEQPGGWWFDGEEQKRQVREGISSSEPSYGRQASGRRLFSVSLKRPQSREELWRFRTATRGLPRGVWLRAESFSTLFVLITETTSRPRRMTMMDIVGECCTDDFRFSEFIADSTPIFQPNQSLRTRGSCLKQEIGYAYTQFCKSPLFIKISINV